MQPSSRIYVAGHRGLVGSALVRALRDAGFANLVLRSRDELDLRDQVATDSFFAREKPEYVFLAAARVGGILANDTRPAEFLRDNLLIQTHVIDAAYRHGARKLMFFGSSCIYPRLAPQPLKEEYLLTGPLEPTNEAYAVAKIAGIQMCQSYRRQYAFDAITVMPANVYGPGDNFDPETSHVLASLVRKFHEAKTSGRPVVIWGTGTPRREFLYVDDLAEACLFLMDRWEEALPINIGHGEDLTITDLASRIARIVFPDAKIEFDSAKPDGTPRKLLDVSRTRGLGWRPRIDLDEGLRREYEAFLASLGANEPGR